MNKENNRLWTRSYVLNNTACFIINVSYYMLMVIMTDYAESRLGASLSMAGFATGAFVIGALLARLLIGGQIERIGLKRSAYIGVVVFLFGLILNFFTYNIGWLSAVRIIQGLGFGIGSTTTGAIMAHMVPVARRGEGTSYYAMFVTLATAIGPYAGAALYDGTLKIDLIGSALLLLVCLVCIRYISVPEIPARTTAENSNESLLTKFIEPKAMPIAIITLLVSLGFAGILGFVSSYEKEIGLTGPGQYFFIVYALFTLISRPFTGRMFDKLGANVVMYPAFIIFGIGLALLSVTSTAWELLLVAACMGLGFGTFMSCAQAIAIMVSPKQRMAVATSTFFIFMDLGVGFGPSLMGSLVPRTGFNGLYLILGIIQFLCAGIYFATTARKLKKSTQSILPAQPETSPSVSSPGLLITIAREYGSGGREIGRQIAAHFGIPCYDQEIIGKIVEESGLPASTVSEEEQQLDTSELYKLYAWYAYSLPGGDSGILSERLFNMDCRIINSFADKGSCVVIGRLADRILHGRNGLVSVFVHASEESETARVSVRDNVSLEEAKEKVRRVNRERAAHCEHFTHTIWRDVAQYDITVNSDLYGIDGTAKFLIEFISGMSKKP